MTGKSTQPNRSMSGRKDTRKCSREHYSHYEDFIEQLKAFNPPLSERFIEIMDEQLDALPLETAETFIFGFRLGAKIILEVLEDR